MHKTPPPRRRQSSTIRREDIRSPLEILQQMGFTKQRAEKAIASTGNRGVQLASDWLLSHVNDPELDTVLPRQYILYLCPVGPLHEQLMDFWEKSLSVCGWNGFHTYFPHITLCKFFAVEDSKVGDVQKAMNSLEPLLSSGPGPVELDFFSQNNFIGLFLQEKYCSFFSEIAGIFAKECHSRGINVEPSKKELHLSLAYQYVGEYHEDLSRLARAIDLSAECQWEVRLYSRDSRLGKSEVRKVKQAYQASLEDELDLIMGDFVFMDTNESTRSSDKWYSGTSWLTGQQGMFPGPYTERTAETLTWALHRSDILVTELANGVGGAQAAAGGPGEGYESLWNQRTSALYAKVDKSKKKEVIKSGDVKPAEKKDTRVPRQLYVLRHAERIDFVFGKSWVDMCFDDQGNYRPCDLNMPQSVPRRANTHFDYVKDSPLTALGDFQAFLTGEALKATGVVFSHVYVSPALRCVQTATSVLKSMGQSPVLHVEPGLFEWLGWYQLGLPNWFTPTELKGHGFNIDVSYKPFIPIEKFNHEEDISDYYKRSGETTKNILIRHQHEGGNVLILGHAGSVEVCTRQLVGKRQRVETFRDMCSKVPYCGILVCQEDVATRKWSVLDAQINALTHGHNKKDNVNKLLYPTT